MDVATLVVQYKALKMSDLTTWGDLGFRAYRNTFPMVSMQYRVR